MPYLFLVTLGPVQDFIASARRTRDLHFGSWFLSEISRAAAYEIGTNQEERLIFPFPENMDWLKPRHHFNVANRILALIEQEPQELAKKVRDAVFLRLNEIQKDAYRGLKLPPEEQKAAEAQIKDLVELVWVALPLDERDYHRVRSMLEAQLAARKNTHAFAQVTWGKDVPKSSLDGHLESVIPENAYPQGNASAAKKQEMLKELYKSYRVGRLGERLSGVDLLKRLGTTAFDTHFPSTSHLAVLPFLERMKSIDDIEKQNLHKKWETYIRRLALLAKASEQENTPIKDQRISSSYPIHPVLAHYDGSLLFEGRLADVLLLPSTDTTNNKDFQAARDAQQDFYEELDAQFSRIKLGKKRPSTYYALLQADGDSMGDLIDAVAERGYEKHRELSKALSRFAERVRETVVNEHNGALIYSGGDDVLAFLPLHTVLKCASKLKTQFGEALKYLVEQVNESRSLENQSLPSEDQRDLLNPPTLSVGIAIVHHLDSLRDVRRLASDAEKLAKQQDDKNSLAIIVSKRGGEDYRAVGKWDNIDVRLSQLMKYCSTASIPAGMAYELRDMTLRLSLPPASRKDKKGDQGEQKRQDETLQKIIRLEALRILLRKLTVPAGKIPKKDVDEIEAYLRVQLALPPKEQVEQQQTTEDANMPQDEPGLPPVSIETFINELVIAQMLAEAAELAQVKE